jgi:hypothetical protein
MLIAVSFHVQVGSEVLQAVLRFCKTLLQKTKPVKIAPAIFPNHPRRPSCWQRSFFAGDT